MPPVRMQLEGPSLEELLGQVQREHGEGARILQAEKIRSGGVGGFFTREHYQIDLEVAEAPARPTQPAPAQPVRAVRPPSSVLDLAEQVNRREAEPAPKRRRSARTAPTAPTRAPAAPVTPAAGISTETPSFAQVLATLQEEVARGDVPATAPLAAPLPTHRSSRPVQAEPASTPVLDERRLLSWLSSLPSVPAPAYAPGQVLVVVGEAEAAMRVAGTLAVQLGADPAAVLLATPSSRSRHVPAQRRLCDPAGMARLRSRWARLPYGTIVVVDAPLVLRPEGWARAAMSALAPAFVWGAVSATTKVADIEAWADRLGHVDALAVEGLEATTDPASVLTSQIPVAMVDGQRATPHLWVALLQERMSP